MRPISRNQISNNILSNIVVPGDVVGKHKYKGGQVDWFMHTTDDNTVLAWYGGSFGEIVDKHKLDIVDEWVVI